MTNEEIECLRVKCHCIITCDKTVDTFNRFLDLQGPEEAIAFLKRATRSVIQCKIPEIEEWYAGTKSKEK